MPEDVLDQIAKGTYSRTPTPAAPPPPEASDVLDQIAKGTYSRAAPEVAQPIQAGPSGVDTHGAAPAGYRFRVPPGIPTLPPASDRDLTPDPTQGTRFHPAQGTKARAALPYTLPGPLAPGQKRGKAPLTPQQAGPPAPGQIRLPGTPFNDAQVAGAQSFDPFTGDVVRRRNLGELLGAGAEGAFAPLSQNEANKIEQEYRQKVKQGTLTQIARIHTPEEKARVQAIVPAVREYVHQASTNLQDAINAPSNDPAAKARNIAAARRAFLAATDPHTALEQLKRSGVPQGPHQSIYGGVSAQTFPPQQFDALTGQAARNVIEAARHSWDQKSRLVLANLGDVGINLIAGEAGGLAGKAAGPLLERIASPFLKEVAGHAVTGAGFGATQQPLMRKIEQPNAGPPELLQSAGQGALGGLAAGGLLGGLGAGLNRTPLTARGLMLRNFSESLGEPRAPLAPVEPNRLQMRPRTDGPGLVPNIQDTPGLPGPLSERVARLRGMETETGPAPLERVTGTPPEPSRIAPIENSPRQFRLETDPKSISAKTWYHGTGTAGLNPKNLDPSLTKIESLFGQGVYLTDTPEIAAGYAQARGKKGAPNVYQARVKVDKVLNFEDPINHHAPLINKLLDHVKGFDEDLHGLVQEDLNRGKIHSIEDLWQSISRHADTVSHQNEIPKSEFYDFFGDMAATIHHEGFDAYTHTGGTRTGRAPHQVLIMLDPNGLYGGNRPNPVKEFRPLYGGETIKPRLEQKSAQTPQGPEPLNIPASASPPEYSRAVGTSAPLEPNATGLANQVQERKVAEGILDRLPHKVGGVSTETAMRNGQAAYAKYNPLLLAEEIGKGGKAPNAEEFGVLLEHARRMEKTLNAAQSALDASPAKDPHTDFLRGKYEEAKSDYMDFLDKVQVGKTESSNAFRALQAGVELDTGNYAQVLAEANRRGADAGDKVLQKRLADLTSQIGSERPLTDAPRDVAAWKGTLKGQMADLEQQVARLKAEGFTAAQGRAYKRAAIIEDRGKIIADIKSSVDSLIGRVGSGTQIPYDAARMLQAGGRLALSYAREGKLTLDEVIPKVVDYFRGAHGVTITPEQITQDIADLSKGKPQTQTEIQKHIAALKREARGRTDAAAEIEFWRERLRKGDYQAPDPRVRKVTAELDQLRGRRELLKKQVLQQLEAKAAKTPMQKALGAAADVAGISRTGKATADMSASMRQAWVETVSGAILRPKATFKALGRQFGAWKNSNFERYAGEMARHPNYELAQRAGLDLTTPGGGPHHGEEQFASKILADLPVVKQSERAYTTYLNQIRFDRFNDLAQPLLDKGLGLHTAEGNKALKDIATVVNVATGRGNLGKLENAAQGLAQVFWAPRLIASRVSLLNPAFYAKLSPVARKALATDLATSLGAMTSIVGLVKLAGGKVGTDSRNSDFGQIRVNHTLIDPWGGLGQYARLYTQLATGETASDHGVRKIAPTDAVGQFLRKKLAPLPAAAVDLRTGKDVTGAPATPLTVGLNLLPVPMAGRDLIEAIQDNGLLKGGAIGIGALLSGVGLQVRQPRGKMSPQPPTYKSLRPIPKVPTLK